MSGCVARYLRYLVIPVFINSGAGAHTSPAAVGGDSLTLNVSVKPGWNVLSLPVDAGRALKDSLFPTSVSSAFLFGDDYRAADTLENGYGFWLKFASGATISVPGIAVFDDTIAVRAGWNLIGGISTDVAINKIQSVPPGIVASNYFSFSPDSGYRHSDTLRPGLGYWVKAGRAGSLVLRSLDVPCPGVSVVNYGGVTYHSVQVAGQCWLRENLNVGEQTQPGLQQTDNDTIEKYCFIDETVNCTKFGGLYQWNEAMQYVTAPGGRGICPPGWHIPTLGELRGLDTTVAGNGNQLKALRQGVGDGEGTNTTGFSALLRGYRHLDGSFSIFGYQTYFWTSTEQTPAIASSLYLFYNYSDLYFYNIDKGYGFSVRCLKD
ncbi:MAG TPA: FISUMP domain-containing protein [Bacteroidota bacterium]|nr:FISUMP domain-containing protein [Bacteroidota bacterium]